MQRHKPRPRSDAGRQPVVVPGSQSADLAAECACVLYFRRASSPTDGQQASLQHRGVPFVSHTTREREVAARVTRRLVAAPRHTAFLSGVASVGTLLFVIGRRLRLSVVQNDSAVFSCGIACSEYREALSRWQDGSHHVSET